MKNWQETYRAELMRLLRLDAEPSEDSFLCVYEPAFHPEWSVRVSWSDGTARVNALDRSAWAWINDRKEGSWSNPVKGWVEPGVWSEDIRLSPEQLRLIRAGFPPLPEKNPGGVDGMYVAFAVPLNRAWEWRRFWAPSTDGARLARVIAETIGATASTERVREASAKALEYLR